MSFSSLIFTALFLPAFFMIYYLVPGTRARNMVLLLFSLLFYAFGGVAYLGLLLIMTLFTTAGGYLIANRRRRAMEAMPEEEEGDEEFSDPNAISLYSKNMRIAKLVLVLTVGLLLVALAVFKYSGFAVKNVSLLFHVPVECATLALPLGMSFYVFKLISYVSDIYTGRLEAKNYYQVLLYTVMFQHVTQGPIVRYPEIAKELEHRVVNAEEIADGAFRFSIGLVKKTVLADHCGSLAETLLPVGFMSGEVTVLSAYLGSLFFMLQLYLDFSAYTDMALGLGKMIGFHFPENFRYPYMATSVRDFWKRWHISLSSFFRDYVYIPMGGNRVSFLRLTVNLFVVWALTGLWHGANWNFVLWGLYFFVFLFIENVIRRFLKKNQKSGVDGVEETENENVSKKHHIACLFGHIYTLLVVYFGWILFRFQDFNALHEVWKLMSFQSGAALRGTSEQLLLENNMFFMIIAILAVTPLAHMLGLRFRSMVNVAYAAEYRNRERLATARDAEQQDQEREAFVRKHFGAEGQQDAEEESAAFERFAGRLEKRIAFQARKRKQIAGCYYFLRTALMLLYFALALISMVGASYTPFLYNQF